MAEDLHPWRSFPTRPPSAPSLAAAPVGRRAVSAAVETVLWLVLAGVAAALLREGLTTQTVAVTVAGAAVGLVLVVGLVVLGLRLAADGTSPGKSALGLRLVDARTGGAPGVGAAWGRWALATLGTAVLVGLVVAAVEVARRPDRRAWYDRATGLVLVDAERGAGDDRARPRALAGASAPQPTPPVATATAVASVAAEVAPPQPPPPPPLSPPLPSPPPSTAVGPPPAAPVARHAGVQHPTVPHPGGTSRPVAADVPVSPYLAQQAVADVALERREASSDTRETPAVPVARVSAPPSGTPAAAPRARLTFGPGRVEEVSGSGVVGRNPSVPAGSGATVRIMDDTRTVSKSHLAFVVEATGLLVTDLASTNGSTVIGTDGVRRALEAGAPTRVPDGATVTVGEHAFVVTLLPATPWVPGTGDPGEPDDLVGETQMRVPR